MRAVFYLLCLFIISGCNTQRPNSYVARNLVEGQSITFDGFGRCFYDPEMVDLRFKIETVGQNIEATSEIHKKKQLAVDKLISDHKDKIVANTLKPSQIKREEFEARENHGNIIVRYRFTSDYFIRTKIVHEIEDFQVKLVSAGADSIYLMDFFSTKFEQYKEEARNNAIDDSKKTMDSVSKKMGWKNIRVIKIDIREPLARYQEEQNSSGRFGTRSVARQVVENNAPANDRQFDDIKGMQYADANVHITFSYEVN